MTLTNYLLRTDANEQAEFFRFDANRKLDPGTRGVMGQFMTPKSVAMFMASLFQDMSGQVSLLDPGSGVGSLTAAFVEEAVSRTRKPKSIEARSYEFEPVMLPYLESTLTACRAVSTENEVEFSGTVENSDFIEQGVKKLIDSRDLLSEGFREMYSHCIVNPPYKKISGESSHRRLLRDIGMETSNLYTAFLTIAVEMLAPEGQLVAIVPRSFCNGTYFKPFREYFLEKMTIRQLHVFDSRNSAFKDDDVLQENIILYAVKGAERSSVTITACADTSFVGMTERTVPFDAVVKKGDAQQFIHVATNDFDQRIVDWMAAMDGSLAEVGLEVCTGPVVDFRLRDDIHQQPKEGLCPLIYAGHFTGHAVCWPKPEGKKPNAIADSPNSTKWLMPNDWYVLTKRFSSKEERRRIVAAVNNPTKLASQRIGFENHLNVFHQKKRGLDQFVARGLALYLNSSNVDLYFRQFSGHTQVNATDLRMLRYPQIDTLSELGKKADGHDLSQREIDILLDKTLHMSDRESIPDLKNKIEEALSILNAIGLPRAQRNERSALTLLALLDLKPSEAWSEARNPLIGITPIMEFCKEHYGRNYAPNTRETFRRQTMHQFMDAGLSLANPDQPDRPVNSPKWVYQIAPGALALVHAFGRPEWDEMLVNYLTKQQSLAQRYAKERDMQLIPLIVNDDTELTLTPGDHSELIKEIIQSFGPRYAPGSEVLYVGDTGSKMGHFDEEAFKELGLSFDSHGKFPDVVLYFKEKNWLLLVESVTSHGPVDAKRHGELANLFSESTAGLVYVTAFPNRNTMAKYLPEIGWETEVWCADAPTHLIHFNGERFLGPYEKA